jgi:hypothetical protein
MTGPTPTPRDREEAEQFVRDWLPDPTHLITARSAIALALAKAREEGRIEGVKHGMANTSELVGTAITRARTDALIEGVRLGIEAGAGECKARIAEPFARMAKALGVGKSDHARGGDLAAVKAITAEECAAFIRSIDAVAVAKGAS